MNELSTRSYFFDASDEFDSGLKTGDEVPAGKGAELRPLTFHSNPSVYKDTNSMPIPGIGNFDSNVFSQKNRLDNFWVIKNSMELLESDRNNLSRELHDGILSTLAAAKLKLQMSTFLSSLSDVQGSVREVIGYMEDLIGETRLLSKSLGCGSLDEFNLYNSISWYCKAMESCCKGLEIKQKIELLEEEIPKVCKIIIYRVLQEAVNNSLRHGQANNIVFSIQKKKRIIVFRITDNGKGFEYNPIPGSGYSLNGNGLKNMRVRVEIVGGTFEIRPRMGDGTRLEISLPADINPGPKRYA